MYLPADKMPWTDCLVVYLLDWSLCDHLWE